MHPTDFRQIEMKFGARTIDLFASKETRLLPHYFSRQPDKNALGVDAFLHKWPEGAYAFPPWIIVNKVLAKIRQDQMKDVVQVTPTWTTQSWYVILNVRSASTWANTERDIC
jgi:hypothetical protein